MPREATTEASSASRSSSTSPTNMWDYHQSHAPFPSWTPYAGTLLAGSTFGADPSPSGTRLPSEHGYGHVWNQGALSNSSGYRENFLDLLASKNVRPELFDDLHAGHYVAQAPVSRCEGSDVWAAAHACSSPLYLANSCVPQGMNMVSCMPCYDHEVKGRINQQQQEFGASMASFPQQIGSSTSVGFQSSLDFSGIGIDKICSDGRAMEAPFSMRSLPDFGSFSDYRSATELMTAKPYMRCADLSDSNRQEHEILLARTSSSGNGAASERKKRPSEERLQESTIKKSKQEASTTSPPKQQVPKVKLGEKITALQQIVSPFGKTDTASVLFETIKYIKVLHEQVQLLSEPYTNSSRNKCNVPWGDVEANKGEVEHDLRGKGLCLVPVSWTPEIYRDNNAMDYWTPAYRGCLYR